MKRGKSTPYESLRRLRQSVAGAYAGFLARFVPLLSTLGRIFGGLTVAGAVVCLVAMIVSFGFDHSPSDLRILHATIRSCQILFIVNILYGLTLNIHATLRQTRPLKWVVNIAVLITLLPLAYPRPDHPWIPFLETLLYSNRFLYIVLGVYCLVEICFGVVGVLGKRTNPSLMLSSSFLLFILLGSLVLMMPRCTYHGISFIDSLFVATSAVCITGLTSVDVATTFTPTGLLVLAVLIQAGGLGVMTFTSFFAIFFSGNTSIYSQLIVRDIISSRNMSALLPTLLYIFLFTIVIEAAGAAAIFLSIHGKVEMGLEDELIFSAFHSLSAFCNAGFSNVEGGLSNPRLMQSSQWLYIAVTLLVAAGGIGFPILMNFKQAIADKLRRLWRRLLHRPACSRRFHIYNLNTRIVLVTSFWIMTVSTLLFLIFEYNNSLAGMSPVEKVVQSWFNSFVPRSSGFSSVNPAGFLNITIIMFIFLMWIGGGSQSTAGGIKVNTFAVMLLNLRAIITGRMKVTACGRTIAIPSLRRAHAVVGLSILSLFIFTIILVGLEPQLPLKALVYEAASALFTVGSSLGITPALSAASKGLLCVAMFLGRVGIISLLVGLSRTHSDPPYRLPDDNVIIN